MKFSTLADSVIDCRWKYFKNYFKIICAFICLKKFLNFLLIFATQIASSLLNDQSVVIAMLPATRLPLASIVNFSLIINFKIDAIKPRASHFNKFISVLIGKIISLLVVPQVGAHQNCTTILNCKSAPLQISIFR